MAGLDTTNIKGTEKKGYVFYITLHQGNEVGEPTCSSLDRGGICILFIRGCNKKGKCANYR